ncbi:Phenylalanine--tRNA ligase beta subunit [Botrimarina colliarenosi]|uniref:Phenylalanine--tRNA ligase beta subunit n=1 Tax=Botrimarina colliarenosi TaxID=2528001 RepID=A0A5C6AN61_9BACT|nr:phenylalanine--tRNA ligase subunit beta [Botrimarina colliarenosi]TWU00699.1 Phenylalanine--tRNA ligase beta subunit [Botrimarina colliarenosi]
MIVSTDWLADYVALPKSIEELTERLTLAGLNLEEFHAVGDDTAIDLEVTSNRPDCLGHIGVAREVAVLFGQQLKRPEPLTNADGVQPRTTVSGSASSAKSVATETSVTVNCHELCPRYTARLIKGVKIGPSPKWLQNRLKTIGVATINNVVDITNYVMMEIGQPLHAFDFAKLHGGKIVVRQAVKDEPFTAINHKEYRLTGDEVVIADAKRPVALGGVMGGADTEVSDTTTDVLIEAADFAPLAVRAAARRHVLQSPSSYRFERGVDPQGIDWASRRCCELILELAGGELCEGVIDIDNQPTERVFDEGRDHVKLRYPQISRLLGVEVSSDEVRKILIDLGCEEIHNCDHCVKVVPPTWRADLTRECDLIEEVARIHGYDKIPAATTLPIFPSAKHREDHVFDQVRALLAGAGFDEAYTLSAVEPELADGFAPWSDGSGGSLSTGMAVLRRANVLRQSVAPSLLACRRTNETLSNPVVELFEIAKVYLPQEGELPAEKRVLAITSGGGYSELKGVLESLAASVAPGAELTVTPARGPDEGALLDASRSAGLLLGGVPLCLFGDVSPAGRERFSLRGPASVAELDLGVLAAAAELVRQTSPLSSYPPVARDLNIVVEESTPWAAIESAARTAGGELAEQIAFTDDSFRDAKQLGEGKKSVVFRVQLRSTEGTLTSDQADAVIGRIVAALESELGGKLRA